jgi:2,5-furandicarboxylate decarboxylase 1
MSGGRRFRDSVEDLSRSDRLLEVTERVEPIAELAAHVEAAHGWPILFHRVGRARFPILYNVFGDPVWVASRLGTRSDGIVASLLDACAHPVEPEPVASRHSIVADGAIDLRDWIPIGQDKARQRVPCLNAGVIIVRDPDTGTLNTSMHTLNLIQPDLLVIHVQSNHFAQVYGKWQKRRQAMPLAVALGVDPALWLACGITIDHPPSELAVAGAFGGPVPMARCSTIDLEVPAAAEIVLEGIVPPAERGPGGPEPLPSYEYGIPYRGPVMVVQRISAFPDAVAHGLLNAGVDHQNQLAWLKEFSVVKHLREAGLAPMVRAIKVNPSGSDWYACAVAIERPHVAEARAIAESLLTADIAIDGLRRVTVVDADIDIGDPAQIEWAVATRMRPDRDVIIVGGGRRGPDPAGREGAVARMGLIATVPPGREADHIRAVTEWNGPLALASPKRKVSARTPQPVNAISHKEA